MLRRSDAPHGVMVVGAGSWGQRVAGKLRGMGERVVTVDPAGGDYDSVQEALRHDVGALPYVVVAVPPHLQRMVALDVIGRNRALTDLRFEKPCCASEDELADVVAAADRAGVQVSCGFTLLAHPAYVWVSKMGGRCTVLHAWRSSSAPARHDVSAMLDLGSHAAGLAAWLGGSPEIVAAHDAGVDVRWTTIRTENVGVVEVDEGAGVVFFRGEPVAFGEHDALRDELRAFLLGAPIADAGTGLAAHRIIAGQAVAA